MRQNLVPLILVLTWIGLALTWPSPRAGAGETGHNTKVYLHQGGDVQTFESGATLNIESGATVTDAGTATRSGAQTLTGKVTFSTGSNPDVSSGVTMTAKSGSTTNLSGTTNVSGTVTVHSGGAIIVEAGAPITLPIATISEETTLTAAQSGMTFVATAADVKVNLPATAAGLQYTITQNISSTTTGLQVSPVAADKIIGASIAVPVDDKDLINTAATDNPGDSVTIVGDGSDGWYVKSVSGTWAKE